MRGVRAWRAALDHALSLTSWPKANGIRAVALQFSNDPAWSYIPIWLTVHRNVPASLSVLEADIEWIRQELATMQDRDGKFELDAFALELKETYEGTAVFDHGCPQTLR